MSSRLIISVSCSLALLLPASLLAQQAPRRPPEGSAKFRELDKDVLDQIFDFMIRDFSKFALQLSQKPVPRLSLPGKLRRLRNTGGVRNKH